MKSLTLSNHKEKIYISGQITGLSVKDYTYNFTDANKRLQGRSTLVRNPLYIRPLFGIKKWFFYMWNDIKILKTCNTIAMQPNWIESRGAIIEYYFAKFIFKLKIIWL